MDLQSLPRFGPKRAATAIAGISSAAASLSLGALMSGLGIPNIGSRTASDLDRAFGGSLKAIREASAEQLQSISGKCMIARN